MAKPIKSILKLERPKSLTDLAGEELRRQIVEGELELGESLSEARIAKQLGVSRTPVREALHQLDIEGLVTTQPQRGTYVFTSTPKDIKDITSLRVTLETSALRLSMVHDPQGLSRKLETITKEMTKARNGTDDRRYLHLDNEFHQALFEYTGNRYLQDAYQTIASKVAALRYRLGGHPDHMQKSFEEHLEITRAVKEQDAEAAEVILVSHVGDKEGSYWHTGDGDNTAE